MVQIATRKIGNPDDCNLGNYRLEDCHPNIATLKNCILKLYTVFLIFARHKKNLKKLQKSVLEGKPKTSLIFEINIIIKDYRFENTQCRLFFRFRYLIISEKLGVIERIKDIGLYLF